MPWSRLIPPRNAGRWRHPRGPMHVWAHRGDSAHHPENTIAAFEAARRTGCDGVELDVRLDASGEAVVFHDDALDRLCERPGRIERLGLDDRRALRVRGHCIPTLAEAIDACGELELDVELKPYRPGAGGRLAAKVAEVVRASGAASRIIVSCFDPIALLQFRRSAPEIAMAYLFHAEQALPLRLGLAAPIAGVAAVHPDERLVTASTVERWHARGYAVNTWTVDDPVRLRALAALGVDGVCTNDPAGALAALGRATSSSASPAPPVP
jgi:glycerophosphoryl diester phosphodiesterase